MRFYTQTYRKVLTKTAAIVLLLCLCLPASNATDVSPSAHKDLLTKANEAFDEEDYAEAIKAYEQAVELGDRSPNLFLLLGNAYFRSGDIGNAALFWRRAQITAPLLTESRQNLLFLESKAGLLRFETDSIDYVINFLPLNLWLIIAVAGSWLFILGLASLSLRPKRKWLRTCAHLGCWLGLAVAITCFTSFAIKKSRTELIAENLGIVTTSTTARASASNAASPVIELTAGSEITLLGQRGPWMYVGIPGDLTGWVRADTTDQLWPFETSHLQ